MPIKFRCPHCEQFLGISRSKAGAVTDCPMCGKTIRVPELDGKIAPLPQPKMNYQDSGLAKALDALASLGNSSEAVAEVQAAPAKAVAITLAPAPAVQPIPIPVPLPSELSAGPSAAVISGPTPPPQNAVSTGPARDALRELSSIPTPTVVKSRGRSLPSRPLLITGAVCGLVGLAGGFFLGRLTASGRSADVQSNAAVPAVQNPGPAATGQGGGPGVMPSGGEPPSAVSIPAGELKPAVEGRLTYVTGSGESRPDVGARILVLPARRPAASKLSVMSFRAGANNSDVKLAQASVRVLGGDFVLAGPDGHYEIQLPATGQYQLLIISRYQGRDPAISADAKDLAVIQDWFDHPLSFFGQTQVMSAPIQFDGQRSSIRDHVFPKAD